MLAVDTNVLVRYLVNDDEAQLARATEIVEHGPIFVSPTVILESEWVLRGFYRLSRPAVFRALEAFCGAPGVKVGDAAAVERAFRLAERGLDFADALHLAQAQGCEAFVTFDENLVRKAKNLQGADARLA